MAKIEPYEKHASEYDVWFAAPLGIRLGIDPSRKMRELALSKGITAIDGVAH